MADLWLDAVLAVPVLGVQLKAPASLLIRLREVVAPALDQLAGITPLEIVHSTGQGGTELRIDGKDGFSHKVVQNESGLHATVSFLFAPIETKTVGQLPSMKYEPRTYSQLISDCARRLELLTGPLLRSQGVVVGRYGLVATAELAAGHLPPGFAHYREWSERPWKKRGGSVVKVQSSILVKLEASDDRADQCHHALGYEHGDTEAEYRLMLDYQRVFAKPPRSSEVSSFTNKAMEYFQQFAFPEARSWE